MAGCWLSPLLLVAIVTMVSPFSGEADSENWCKNCRGEAPCNNFGLHQVPLGCCELANSSSESGVYLVSGAEGNSFARKLVSCDTSGGWTVVQRRTGGTLFFNRTWNEYENGFGDLNGEFWYGLKGLNAMTSQGEWEMRVELHQIEPNEVHWFYSRVEVKGADEHYKLLLTEQSTSENTINFMQHFNGMKFSTYDRDNDGVGTLNCASIFQGGWWYTKKCWGDKSFFLNKQYSDEYLVWAVGNRSRDKRKIVRTEMKIRPRSCPQTVN